MVTCRAAGRRLPAPAAEAHAWRAGRCAEQGRQRPQQAHMKGGVSCRGCWAGRPAAPKCLQPTEEVRQGSKQQWLRGLPGQALTGSRLLKLHRTAPHPQPYRSFSKATWMCSDPSTHPPTCVEEEVGARRRLHKSPWRRPQQLHDA